MIRMTIRIDSVRVFVVIRLALTSASMRMKKKKKSMNRKSRHVRRASILPISTDNNIVKVHFIFNSVPSLVSSLFHFYLCVYTTDVDECVLDNGGCSHICSNTNGSFTCLCPNGLFLESDNSTCQGFILNRITFLCCFIYFFLLY